MTTDDLMNDYAMLKSTLDRLGIKYRESYENMMIRVEVAYKVYLFSIKDRYKLCKAFYIADDCFGDCSLLDHNY